MHFLRLARDLSPSSPPLFDPCLLTEEDLRRADLDDQSIFPSDLPSGRKRVLLQRKGDGSSPSIYQAYAKEEGAGVVPIGLFLDPVVATVAVLVAERGGPSFMQPNRARFLLEERVRSA